jgi:hypothetical protein
MLEENDKLLEIYNEIKKNEKVEKKTEYQGIKVGDIVTFVLEKNEIKSTIIDIIDDKYIVEGYVQVDFDQIIEHFPKNVKFSSTEEEVKETKKTVKTTKKSKNTKKFSDKVNEKQKDTKVNKYTVKETKKIDNKPNVKFDKPMVVFTDKTPMDRITDIISNNENIKYFVRLLNNEIHIVDTDRGGKLDLKSLTEETVKYLISNNKLSNDKKLKIVGNNSFCIVKECDQSSKDAILNMMVSLLK